MCCICVYVYLYLTVFVCICMYLYLYMCIGGKLSSRWERPGKKLIAPTLITPVQPTCCLLVPAAGSFQPQKKPLFPSKSSDHCGGKSHNPQERHAAKNSFLPKLFFKFSSMVHGGAPQTSCTHRTNTLFWPLMGRGCLSPEVRNGRFRILIWYEV